MDAMELNREMIALREAIEKKLMEQRNWAERYATEAAIKYVETDDDTKALDAKVESRKYLREVKAWDEAIKIVGKELEAARQDFYSRRTPDKPA